MHILLTFKITFWVFSPHLSLIKPLSYLSHFLGHGPLASSFIDHEDHQNRKQEVYDTLKM